MLRSTGWALRIKEGTMVSARAYPARRPVPGRPRRRRAGLGGREMGVCFSNIGASLTLPPVGYLLSALALREQFVCLGVDVCGAGFRGHVVVEHLAERRVHDLIDELRRATVIHVADARIADRVHHRLEPGG